MAASSPFLKKRREVLTPVLDAQSRFAKLYLLGKPHVKMMAGMFARTCGGTAVFGKTGFASLTFRKFSFRVGHGLATSCEFLR